MNVDVAAEADPSEACNLSLLRGFRAAESDRARLGFVTGLCLLGLLLSLLAGLLQDLVLLGLTHDRVVACDPDRAAGLLLSSRLLWHLLRWHARRARTVLAHVRRHSLRGPVRSAIHLLLLVLLLRLVRGGWRLAVTVWLARHLRRHCPLGHLSSAVQILGELSALLSMGLRVHLCLLSLLGVPSRVTRRDPVVAGRTLVHARVAL